MASQNQRQAEPPSVIDDDMLRNAIEEQGPPDRIGEIAKEDGGIDFATVTSLRLDFRRILEIRNLWCFTNVVRLQLSHNVIEKIEGLDNLVLLKHLDLSFNHIGKMENLDLLVKLEDLILYSNDITVIENLDSLKQLQLLSIGYNQLSDLRNVVYLRRFKNLKSLCLLGNPFTDDIEAYKVYVLATLPNLEYLDNFLVDQNLRQKGFDKYELMLMQIEEQDKTDQKNEDEELENRTAFEFHKSAFVENLAAGQLFNALFAKDTEGRKFLTYQDIYDVYDSYEIHFSECCRHIYDFGIKKHKERTKELEDFNACAAAAQEQTIAKSREKVSVFMEYKAQLWPVLEGTTDHLEVQRLIDRYNSKLTVLQDKLFDDDFNLVDQLEEIIKELQRATEDINLVFLEYAGAKFAQCRELENKYHENVMVIAGFMADRAAKHEVEEGIDLDLQALIADKGTMIGILNSSHDMRLLVLDSRQDAMATAVNQWHEDLINGLHNNMEIKRNRERIEEILHFINHHRAEGREMAADLMVVKHKHVSIVEHDDQ